MVKKLLSFILFLSLVISLQAQRITILHTNDMHSRLLGFAPNSDYSPFTTSDDETLGGFARLATAIETEKTDHPDDVLVVDAGDFLMGTLFHTLEPETGFQLRLMHQMGYEVVTIGNHEFDMGIEVLGDIIAQSQIRGDIPQLLLGNILFNPEASEDNLLENLVQRGTIKPYTVIEKNGLKIGLFGLLGYEAALVAPYVKPASFTDPVEQAAHWVDVLRNTEKVDVVVCLSHSGVSKDKEGNWVGEDHSLAQKVQGIDVIISGHSHSTLTEPVLVGKTIIVQTGSEARNLGKLVIEKEGDQVSLIEGRLIEINDNIRGNAGIQALIDEQMKLIGEKVLDPYGFSMNTPLVETDYELSMNEQGDLVTSELGPLLADAIYWYARRIAPEKTDLVMIPAGIIRDNIVPGKSGIQLPADIFRILPLGMGVNERTPGYSMTKVYLTGREVKNVLEVMMLAPSISTGNYPFWSGVRFKYNKLRMPLDKIYEVELGNDTDGYQKIRLSKDENQLYGLVTNAYIMEFFGLVKQITKGILKVEPKYADGTVIPDLKQALMDRDPSVPGIQEAKEWAGLMMYLHQLPDTNGNGIADIPEVYRQPQSGSSGKASVNPVLYLKGTNGISLVPAFLGGGIVAGALLLIL